MSANTIYRCDNACGAEESDGHVVNAYWFVMQHGRTVVHLCSAKCLAEYANDLANAPQPT